MPTTAQGGAITIARGAPVASTNGTGGQISFIGTGTAALGSCTVTLTGTVGTANITWAYTTAPAACGKSKTGYGT
jgi:hypothetical protein